MKSVKQGAEAIIYLDDDIIIKDRITKGYRIREIDERLRKYRTRAEIKLLRKAGIKVLHSNDEMKISMEYINGTLLKNVKLNKEICCLIGRKIKELHDKGIIHGDLTTANMILKKNEICFIDFGLGFFSDKIEDKAVDLYLLKQVFKSEYDDFDELFKWVLEAYDDKKVMERLGKVEGRGRYKNKLSRELLHLK